MKQGAPKIERTAFHYIQSGSLASGAASLSLSPASITRLATVADVFALYRFVDLRFRLLPNAAISAAAGAEQVASYEPGIVDTAPASSAAGANAINSVVLSTRQSVPTEWCHVDDSTLRTYTQWLKTVAGTPATDVEVQGTIFINGAGTDGYLLEMRGVVEFKNPINAGSTPALVREAMLSRERDRLLAILAASPTAGGSAKTSVTAGRSQAPCLPSGLPPVAAQQARF